jgi:hypothetical protein
MYYDIDILCTKENAFFLLMGPANIQPNEVNGPFYCFFSELVQSYVTLYCYAFYNGLTLHFKRLRRYAF